MILQVIPRGAFGGAEKVAANLSDGFRALGIPSLIASLVDLPNASFFGEADVVCLGARRSRWSILALVRLIHRVRPIKIIAHLHHAVIVSVIAARIVGLLGVKVRVFAVLHSDVRRDAHMIGGAEGSISSRVRGGIRSLGYRLADGVVVLSSSYRSDPGEIFGVNDRSVHVIENPIIHADSLRNASFDRCSGRHGRTVGFLGRLEKIKGPDRFLDVVRALPVTISASIAGDGSEMQFLRERAKTLGIEERSEFLGFVDSKQWLKRIDILLVTSRSEVVPTVIIEALNAGVPVVAFNCARGISDLASDCEWIRLVEDGCVESMAQEVQDLLGQVHEFGRPVDFLRRFEIVECAAKYANL